MAPEAKKKQTNITTEKTQKILSVVEARENKLIPSVSPRVTTVKNKQTEKERQ